MGESMTVVWWHADTTGSEAQGLAGHPLPWRLPSQHDLRPVVAQPLVQGQRLMAGWLSLIQGENGEEKRSEGKRTQPICDSICRCLGPPCCKLWQMLGCTIRTQAEGHWKTWRSGCECCFKRRKMAAHPQRCHPQEGWHCPALWPLPPYLGDRAPWVCCTHQPQHFLTAAADGRGASPASHSEHSLGPLPHHRGLLSLGISWGTAESSAGGLALK